MILNRSSTFAFLCAAGLSWSGEVPARALTPYRVADVDPTFRSASSSPRSFVRIGSRTLFIAQAPGLGLWASDGTASGTRRLLAAAISIDLVAATGDLLFVQICAPQVCRLQVTDGTPAGTRQIASGGQFLAGVAAGPRRIYFVRQTPAAGTEPWTSDGTVAGTRIVKDLAAGPAGSGPQRLTWSNGRLWFFAVGGLWTSDGTAAGTRRIATVGTGEVRAVGTVGSRLLYFAAATPLAEQRLWVSDGTAAGTKPLGVANPGNQLSEPFATAGVTAYFTLVKDDGEVFVRELWATDGTRARTRKVVSFGISNFPPRLVSVGNRVAFVAGDFAHGRELWSSDGTAAGTRGIEVCPGSCSGLDEIGGVDGGRLWFAGTTPGTGRELWISDLSAAGTRLVKDLEPGPRSSEPQLFLVGGGKVFFTARPAFSAEEAWSSDGTALGTRRLAQGTSENPQLLFDIGALVGGRAFFALTDGVHGTEPWVSDGTPAGTRLIADLDPSQEGGSFPRVLRSAGGRCYFLTRSGESNLSPELWSSDGTVAGTFLARRLDDSQALTIARSADLGSRIALVADIGFRVAEIWISDGTAGGTFHLGDADLLPTGKFRAVGHRLYFEATDAAHGNELWTTDGTVAGTVRLSDFADNLPFPEGFQNNDFRALGNRLAFLATDSFGRLEPWVSDGTIGGTRRLAEVYPALAASFFELSSEIVEAGGKFFYVSGEESEVGTEPALWVSDLTAAGTMKVGALRDSTGVPVTETGLFAFGGKALLFYQGSAENGFWSSDGTSLVLGAVGAGGAFGSNGLEPKVWNGRLVYRGEDNRLYATDGTAAGTTRLRNRNGSEVINPEAFAVLAGRLAFSTFEGIWDTDGTPQGTVRRVAPRNNNPVTEFVRAGERIFFPGYDAATGTELWALRP